MGKYPEPDCKNVACVECGAFLQCDFADKYSYDELKHIFKLSKSDIAIIKEKGMLL